MYSNQQEGMYLIVQDNRDGKVSVSPMLLSVPFAEEEPDGPMMFRHIRKL